MANGALDGVRVLDLTDERAIYAGKLLADLGADVVRPEPPDGDPLRARGPFVEDGPQGTRGDSLWFAWFASNRRLVTVDPDRPDDAGRLRSLAAHADVVLVCDGTFAIDAADLDGARTANPALVVVRTTSFGRGGPWQDHLAPDLVAGALAGQVATTGDADTVPLKTFGDLNFIGAGTWAAIAALAALRHARETGEGQRVEAPVHEGIAACLEQVFMMWWYGERIGRERVLPRRAGLHWSNVYDVMRGANGAIMVTPAPDFEAQLTWLIEEGVQQDLIEPKYLEPENLLLLGARMMEVLREWVATQDVESLFFRAQERHSPYGWVLPVERLADNPQLAAREWWTRFRVGGHDVTGPGAPYRFSDTPWQHADGVAAVLADIGWENAR